MKKFIVDTGKKKYSVEANDAEHAAKLVKMIICKDDITYRGFKIYKVDGDWEVESSNGEMWNYDGRLTLQQVKAKLDKGIDKNIWDSRRTIDEASQLQTVNALIEDEKAAVEAYNVAIENLRGKIPDDSLQAIIAIRDDENRHIENLQAVVNGTVTEKNLEDSMINDGITECYEALEKAKDAISTIYKNYAKEQDSEYMLKKLNEASSAIARAIRQYKAW